MLFGVMDAAYRGFSGSAHNISSHQIRKFDSDPNYSKRVELVDASLQKLPESFEKDGESYDALRTSYLVLTGQRAGALNVASRQIGGIYNNRALIGQDFNR